MEPMGERGRQGAAPLGGHTPGPWKWDKHGDLRGDRRNAVFNPSVRGDVLSGVNREADARLIAAAPDLLEALENAVGDHVGTADDCEDECWSHRARAAIAKARGEQ